MRIAFYAPLKAPDHPVPSGDRTMARLLVRALERGGHAVRLASRLRSYRSDPREACDADGAAAAEAATIAAAWQAGAAPQLWLCYHPYYKAPDLIGPALCRRFSIPYVTVESSYAGKRDRDAWAPAQQLVAQAIRQAALNICMTARDAEGIVSLAGAGPVAMLKPFVDASALLPARPAPGPARLVTLAMMRAGDKLESYRFLAAALARCLSAEWSLAVIGDGPMRREVHAAFSALPPQRLVWHGEAAPEKVPALLAAADIFVWPGFGEAYGLAYLEAQGCGLPVVAQATGGVPEVVLDGTTGFLAPQGDVEAFGRALGRLLGDGALRRRMGQAARAFVLGERSLDAAAARLSQMLEGVRR